MSTIACGQILNSIIFQQKSKKIFDPSEQDQPSRKRKGSESSGGLGYSQSAFPQASNAGLSNSTSPRSGQVARQNNASLSPSIRGAAGSSTKTISVTSSPSTLSNPLKSLAIKRENACMYCGLDTPKQKRGRLEHLLRCKDCVNIGKIYF